MVLRWFSKIFFQVLDVASFSLFLMVLDCPTWARPDDVIGYNQQFPEQRKRAMEISVVTAEF
jgi:hypothetical protein